MLNDSMCNDVQSVRHVGGISGTAPHASPAGRYMVQYSGVRTASCPPQASCTLCGTRPPRPTSLSCAPGPGTHEDDKAVQKLGVSFRRGLLKADKPKRRIRFRRNVAGEHCWSSALTQQMNTHGDNEHQHSLLACSLNDSACMLSAHRCICTESQCTLKSLAMRTTASQPATPPLTA